MDLTKMLMDSLGNQGIEQIGRQVGMDSSKTQGALGAAIPMLLGAMAQKTSGNEQEASGLLGALDRDHDGSILDDIGGFLNGGVDTSMGDGILKHILGGNRATAESGLAGKLGVDAGSMSKILAIAAPLVMAYLGKQKRATSTSGFNSGGIADILGQLAGGSRQSSGIDLGDIMDMVGGLSGGGSKSSGGGLLGGLLKGVLGK